MIDPENPIHKLCAEGIALEGSDLSAAGELYMQAWKEAGTDAEKATAAHYLARVQADLAGKLAWDQKALVHGMRIEDQTSKNVLLPSLYLNVGKGLEDCGQTNEARQHYELGLEFINALPEDGYVKLIKGGLQRGLERTA